MKRLLKASVVIVCLASCSNYEEYTPPSPIEILSKKPKPDVFDQNAPDQFGDEGLDGIDAEPKDDFDPRIEQQKEIQDDIATLERKKRAKKLTHIEVKNITIKRKTAEHKAKIQPRQEAPVVATPQPIKEAAPKKVEADLKLDDDDLDSDD